MGFRGVARDSRELPKRVYRYVSEVYHGFSGSFRKAPTGFPLD